MLKLFKIAITGAFGSGKSTVGLVLKGLGAFVIDADVIVKELLSPTSPVSAQVIECFGDVIKEDQKISYKKLADIVFTDSTKLHQLEKVLHPHVLKELEDLFENVRQQNHYHLFAVEFPLLFELQKEKEYDYIILVDAKPEICKKNIEKRGYDPSEYEKRMRFQLPTSEKIKKADFVITNNGTYEDLRKAVEQVVEKISLHPKAKNF